MDVDRWTLVQTLFEAALDRAPDERSAFLRASCGNDPALYEELIALLAADAHTHPLLDGRALDALAPEETLALFENDRPGDTTAGPWRLGERIGMGGMGAVYRAERDDGAYEQTVALKLVKRGMDSESVLARFQAERQILARLQHPGIARLIDGGLAQDGRPYFAMEYIDGEPLTRYADRERLSVEARLRLFVKVCEAVRYAHRNLVVHRDLKPSNILVASTPDGAHAVKLLDFGIARMLHEDDDALLTQAGHRILTPAYAAPEQVTGGPITTSTDVYALGGLLYRLLCGAPPITLSGKSATEIERAVLGQEPKRPSAAVTAEAAATRSSTVERLSKRLRGDLDTITLTALNKEPERRYGSAAELLDDIVRYLGDLPIAARPESSGYRLQKFVARHTAGVATALTVLILTTLLVSFYTTRLAAERDRARMEADKAEEVSAFLASILEGADPLDTPGDTLTALDLLERGAARIETDLAGEPEVQAAMLLLIGNVYDNLGRVDDAERLLRAALSIRQRLYPDGHPDVAEAERELAIVLRHKGKPEEAEPLLRSALVTLEDHLPPDDLDVVYTMRQLASLLRDGGDYETAEALYRDALARALRHHDEADHTVTDIKNSLSVLLESTGRFEEATALLREVIATERQVEGLNPELIGSLTTLAGLLREQDQSDEAEKVIREVVDLNLAIFGPSHTKTATSYRNLASVLRDRGAYDEAAALYEQALSIRLETYGPDHPRVANLLNSYGNLRRREGNLEAALDLYQETLRIYRAQERADPARVSPVLHNVATLHHILGHWDEAERLYRSSLDLLRTTMPEGSPDLAFPMVSLGNLLNETRRYREALPYLEESVTIRRARLPPTHPFIVQAEEYLSETLVGLDQVPSAQTMLRESVARLTNAAGADDSLTLEVVALLDALPPSGDE